METTTDASASRRTAINVPDADFLQSALVSKRAHYHYWFTPKCACTTTKNALWAIEAELGHCEPIDDPRYVHARQSLATSPWYVAADDVAAAWNEPGRYTFTFVRNPYARALSAYVSVSMTTGSHAWFRGLGWNEPGVPTLIEFLELIAAAAPETLDHHWRPLSDLIPFSDVAFDAIGHVETYEADLARMVAHAFGPPVTPAFSQKMYFTGSGSQPVEDEVGRLIRRIYAEDFERFGYSLDPVDRQPRAPARIGAR